MNLFSYVDKYGDKSFDEVSFNEVDNAVFSSLSYISFDGIVSDNRYNKITIRDASNKYFKLHSDTKKYILVVKQAVKLLRYIKDTKRYGDLYLYNYVYDAGVERQFSAVTIELNSRLVYVSFEGTDHLVSGWKEDFMMTYKFPIPSQRKAINYINRKSTACAKIIYDLMFEDGYVFSDEEFKYICFALFMDSISFKSSKALEVDHLFAKDVINGEGFDYNWFYKKGLCLNDLEDNLDSICFNGEKEYVINDYKFNSTYIQVDKDTDELFEQKCIENIRNHMTENIDFWLYIINNVETNSSKYIIIDKTNTITHIVPKLLSRGTDIVPLVLKELKNIRNLELVQNNYSEIVRKLIDRNLTISTMESCTGGLISSTITDHEGASNILKGAFVTYSNEAKILQGVPEEIINNFGVYSYETAINMAIACQKTYKSNIGIGITGTTGNVDVNTLGEYIITYEVKDSRIYQCPYCSLKIPVLLKSTIRQFSVFRIRISRQ